MTIVPRLGEGTQTLDGLIRLAVLAVGGQGGGVLMSWIEDMARAAGWRVQGTSVAGVAQRTGATVYYIEMCPASSGNPVFGLMPAAGDVDILIAAELAEAGRAVLRGFVTPDRTTLIASTHRVLAVSEKIVPGDGITSRDEVMSAITDQARLLVAADFEAVAQEQGSVISASLFGALAASGSLPFAKEDFAAVIRAGGKGIDRSLRAFEAGFAAAQQGAAPVAPSTPAPALAPDLCVPARLMAAWTALAARVQDLPAPAQDIAMAGLKKVVDFQDIAYGAEYLDTLLAQAKRDTAPFLFTAELAKYLANAMVYDDLIRVADLKTRSGRWGHITGEMGVGSDQILQVTEFLHPRAEEIVGQLPKSLGQKVMNSPKWMVRLDRWINKGRRLRSDRLRDFMMLYVLAGLRPRRRRSLRHAIEVAHWQAWLDRAIKAHGRNPALGVEILRCRRLIKGYSDTHARGQSKFDRVMAGIDLVEGREDAADWARRLREAALQDAEGKALDGALATIRSFAVN